MSDASSPTEGLTDELGQRRLHPLEAGDPPQIGPYRLLCRLPRGGQGADVFVGRHDAADPLVVVKCLPDGAGELVRRRFAREVENAARIRSPRVAQIVDQDLTAANPYYAQEYVAGTPLDEFLASREGGLNAEELRRIAIGLLRALRDAHAAAVVHRDVKPANIIITDRDVFLVDFGISRYLGSEGPSGTVTTALAGFGSKLFASPEQLQGLPLTEASDVYSWGMVIAYAAGARHPVDPDDELPPADYWLELRAGRVDLSAVPPNLLDPVSHALRVAPERRPSVAELAREVEQQTRWLGQPSEIPSPRTVLQDLRSAVAVREAVRYQLSRLERAIADTPTGYAAAIAAAVLLGLVAAVVLGFLTYIIF
ncbi:serine/threonine-protein kinase [Modestobacter sp. VKM Ac-2983]|uniref:serine/threonine-protein kinase n=1 Tax=Modestobacter sp. VKM Ac-2983 TaxID=3004137 RepID=UPI0022AB9817|nr:serine/threonine-protein kinase [Modestobacter sp. VKM Ac-2983]MCZ2804873.1 serine/threonine-protein kinase [Modestobacter sp. VKM Ac-2983]